MITVVGAGNMGMGVAIALATRGVIVEVVDRDPVKLRAIREGRCPVPEAGWRDDLPIRTGATPCGNRTLVCTGTNTDGDGRYDLGLLCECLSQLPSNTRPVVVSTLPIGCLGRLREASTNPDALLYHPVFVRAGTASGDYARPGKVIVGDQGTGDPTPEAREFAEWLAPVLAADCITFVMPWDEAAATKMTADAFCMTKIGFGNAMADVLRGEGLTTEQAVRSMGAAMTDPTLVSTRHMGPGAPWSGTCFPKDMRHLLSRPGAGGLFRAIARDNDQMIERALTWITGHIAQGRTVGVYGLGHRPGFDEMREGLGAELVKRTHVVNGAWIVGYDAAIQEGDWTEIARGDPWLLAHEDQLRHSLPELLACDAVVYTHSPYEDLDIARYSYELYARPLPQWARAKPAALEAEGEGV